MNRWSTLGCGLVTTLLGVGLPAQAEPRGGSVTISNALLFTGEGEPIAGATMVVRNGVVEQIVKPGSAVRSAGAVIDAQGRYVTPGLVDANTLYGVKADDQNEQAKEVTPHLRIADAIDPRDKRFLRARRFGVTTVYVAPGNRNVIGGLGCVLKTAGDSVADMLLRDDEGLRVALGGEPSSGNRAIRGGVPASIYNRRPTTRMGVIWEIRKAFYDAQQYRSDRGTPLPGQAGGVPVDNGMEVLLQALDKKLQVRTTARAEQDIRTALRLAEEFGYRLVIDEGTEAYRVLDLIAAAGVPVVASPPSSLAQRDGAEPRWSTIALLAEKGVDVALQSGDLESMALVHEAIHALRAGMPHHKALASITSVPARVLGVGDRVGTLAAGRDGDFVIWSGDPLEVTSRPQAIYIDGIDRTE